MEREQFLKVCERRPRGSPEFAQHLGCLAAKVSAPSTCGPERLVGVSSITARIRSEIRPIDRCHHPTLGWWWPNALGERISMQNAVPDWV
jgi:hypothetical protein